jgi:hypothetical protein
MQISGKIYQITSQSGKSFLNVDDEDGNIQVWGNLYNTIAIFAQKSCDFSLILFDNMAYYEEWLLENEKYFDKIQQINAIE